MKKLNDSVSYPDEMGGSSERPEDLFIKLERIGRGSFGEVFKALNRKTGEIIAIKVLDLDTDEDEIADVQKEIRFLSQIDSDFCTHYYGSYLNGYKLWVVMDYAAGGSLRNILSSGAIEEPYIAVIAREVLCALSYLHNVAKIIHRDIKAANILLTDTGKIKICDFGVAGQVSAASLRRHSFVGTPFWMAPEIINRNQYDFKADIWSLGITIIELATGNPPFADKDARRALYLIPRTNPAQLDRSFSAPIREFVSLCLKEEPSERPTADELLKTVFIRSAPKGTRMLTNLITRQENWKARQTLKEEGHYASDSENSNSPAEDNDDETKWLFDTYKTSLNRHTSQKSSDLKKQSPEIAYDNMETVKVKQTRSEPTGQPPLSIRTDSASSLQDDGTNQIKPVVGDETIKPAAIYAESAAVLDEPRPFTENDAQNIGPISPIFDIANPIGMQASLPPPTKSLLQVPAASLQAPSSPLLPASASTTWNSKLNQKANIARSIPESLKRHMPPSALSIQQSAPVDEHAARSAPSSPTHQPLSSTTNSGADLGRAVAVKHQHSSSASSIGTADLGKDARDALPHSLVAKTTISTAFRSSLSKDNKGTEVPEKPPAECAYSLSLSAQTVPQVLSISLSESVSSAVKRDALVVQHSQNNEYMQSLMVHGAASSDSRPAPSAAISILSRQVFPSIPLAIQKYVFQNSATPAGEVSVGPSESIGASDKENAVPFATEGSLVDRQVLSQRAALLAGSNIAMLNEVLLPSKPLETFETTDKKQLCANLKAKLMKGVDLFQVVEKAFKTLDSSTGLILLSGN